MSAPEDRLVNPAPKPDDRFDRTLRPQKLDELIGQQRVKENLKILIEAAHKT